MASDTPWLPKRFVSQFLIGKLWSDTSPIDQPCQKFYASSCGNFKIFSCFKFVAIWRIKFSEYSSMKSKKFSRKNSLIIPNWFAHRTSDSQTNSGEINLLKRKFKLKICWRLNSFKLIEIWPKRSKKRRKSIIPVSPPRETMPCST